jgi:hypothetical protein
MGQSRWIIEFYKKSNNRCPTEDFLNGLLKAEILFVERAIDRLSEFGNNLRRPHADYLAMIFMNSESKQVTIRSVCSIFSLME